jgi:BlaI family transcriptional regulator, penicillinase repressor
VGQRSLPELSRFELECLRRLWARGEASVREVHEDFTDPPSYSTVRKIFERLEAKGAIERLRRTDRAWVYRSTVAPQAMIRKEILRLLEGLFGGRGAPLVAHLADMEALSLDDIREIESRLAAQAGDRRAARRP